MKKLAVVAFGGNALLRGDQQGTIDEQEANALMTSERLLTLIKRDYDLVITHGNGPQVGNIILANSAGAKLHVNVLLSNDHWFGVTYHEDKAWVSYEIRKLVAKGIYPEKLFA